MILTQKLHKLQDQVCQVGSSLNCQGVGRVEVRVFFFVTGGLLDFVLQDSLGFFHLLELSLVLQRLLLDFLVALDA